MNRTELYSRQTSRKFYEERYRQGYMGHWSSFEKERIFNLVKDLHLPEKGIALDFGCGRGIFTSVIQQALPGWEIYGCDISAPAIEYAKEHFKGITFFVLGDEKYKNLKADFLHSHHVIEHTFDLTVTAREMTEFLKERAVMLHSLPCGHAGSLEHRLASMASEGIQLSTGTYFFEDPAHLRRLSAMQLDGYFMEYCFNRKKSYYANQYYGAIYWLSNSSLSQVLQITDSQKANDEYAAQKMRKWRFVLLFTWMCFFATSGFSKLDRGKYYFLKRLLRIAATLLLFPVSLPVRAYINHKAKHEWVKQSGSENGSDMFLVYQRP